METRDGSSLCLRCGLCCRGALHSCVRILADEVAGLEAEGFEIRHEAEGPVFSLPCLKHQEGCCSIYQARPHTCQSYQCGLLKRYLAHEIELDASLELVEKVKGLLDSLRRRMGDPEDPQILWRQLQAQGASLPEALGEDALLDLAAFSALCARHFLERTGTAAA